MNTIGQSYKFSVIILNRSWLHQLKKSRARALIRRWSKFQFQGSSETDPRLKWIGLSYHLEPRNHLWFHMNCSNGKTLLLRSIVKREKLFCPKDPFQHIWTIELGKSSLTLRNWNVWTASDVDDFNVSATCKAVSAVSMLSKRLEYSVWWDSINSNIRLISVERSFNLVFSAMSRNETRWKHQCNKGK